MSRVLTNWALMAEKRRPSLLWLIEHAPTLGMLEEFLAMAVQAKDANPDTRRRWAEAAERQAFILERMPPTFEKVGVEEAFGKQEDPRLKMTPAEAVALVLDTRYFASAEYAETEITSMAGPMPLSAYLTSSAFIPKDGYRPVERYYFDHAGKKHDNERPSIQEPTK